MNWAHTIEATHNVRHVGARGVTVSSLNASWAAQRLPLLDPDCANCWHFPMASKYPEREYQFNIVASALAFNTLVSLPTGLGKVRLNRTQG